MELYDHVTHFSLNNLMSMSNLYFNLLNILPMMNFIKQNKTAPFVDRRPKVQISIPYGMDIWRLGRQQTIWRLGTDDLGPFEQWKLIR